MPQASYTYAVARIRAQEKGLIGRDKMHRLAEGSLDDVMRMLHEAGYGDMPDAGAADCELMIAKELEKTAHFIQEISPDPEVTDIFLMKADVHNLKALIKARLLGNAEEPFLLSGGVYDKEMLRVSVREHDYRDLPKAFAEALNALEKELAVKEDPQRVSLALDKAYHQHARDTIHKRGGGQAFLKTYFDGLADFNNILAMLRLREMGASKDSLAMAFLPAGDVALSALINAFEQPFETLIRMVATGKAGAEIAAGLAEVQRLGYVSALEKARDDTLIRLVKKNKYDVMTLWPVLGFLMAREQEARCIRLIITAKRNGLPEGVIAERLRELYG